MSETNKDPSRGQARPDGQGEAGAPSRNGARKRWLAIVIGAFVLLGAGYGAYWALALRYEQSTDDAYVSGNVVQITPQIAGTVVAIGADDTQFVKAGDTLVQLDPADSRIAVEQAEAKLASVGLTIGASTAGVASAQAKLAEMTAKRDNTRDQTARVLELVKRGTYAAARGDTARAESKAAEAALQQAKAELERARESLGPQGADNPQLREAMAALQQARLDLSRTDVLAPSDGLVTNLQLTTGQYAGLGQLVLASIDIPGLLGQHRIPRDRRRECRRRRGLGCSLLFGHD